MTALRTRPGFRARIAAVATAVLLLGAASLSGFDPVSIVSAPAPAHAADLDDFTIESFTGEYRLGIDEAGRSTLHTSEHIVAVFPEHDQNRGLIRDLVRVYDGHSTDLQVLSVTDEHGTPRDYSLEPYGDFLSVVMAVPEGSYVHGAQHYVVEYTQRDVTRHFDDTGADEFYWDINGTDWRQPFGSLTATVILDESLVPSLNGDSACYRGQFGETGTCGLTQDGATFQANESTLAAGENVTVALGFTPGTFATAPTPPKPPVPWLERYPVLLWAGLACLAAAFVTFITSLIKGRGSKTGRPIIAQYEPPEGISLAVAADLVRAKKQTMTAALLDFAVRRKLRLLRDDASDSYGIQALDADGLDPLEAKTYAAIFGSSSGVAKVKPGTTHWMSRTDTRIGDAAKSLLKRASAETKSLGYRRKPDKRAITAVVILTVAALALPILHSLILGDFILMAIFLALGVNVLVWSLFIAITVLSMRRPVSPEGALILDHLKGLREYIRLAEADRIRMLQSASGAEVDEQRIVQVYERLLPYAVLFGFEKEWQGELAKYYRETAPDWAYNTSGNASSFSSALPLVAFTNSVMSSKATPAAFSSGSGSGSSFSSFSGGSSGGGFSGGGGGGGGGRGI